MRRQAGWVAGIAIVAAGMAGGIWPTWADPGAPPAVTPGGNSPSASGTASAFSSAPPSSTSSMAASPSSVPPAADTAGASPASRSVVPLKRFEPLAAFPYHTQAAVRGVVAAAAWLQRHHHTHGRFLYGFNPALREPLLGDDDLIQARAAFALAVAARFCGEDKYTAAAAQTILTLLTAAPVVAGDPQMRVPRGPSDVCNRVGFAAAVILAIHALPAVEPRLLEEGERLAAFLQRQARPDGSIHYIDDPAGQPLRQDPTGVNEHPCWGLWALTVSQRYRPAADKAAIIRRGLQHYRAHYRTQPQPMLAATLLLAAAEWYTLSRDAEAAAIVCEAADGLCRGQIAVTDPRLPQWAGGFRQYRDGRWLDSPSGPETGIYLLALAAACQVTRQVPDTDRFHKYAAAAGDACRYQIGLQYSEANTRHFDNAYRAHMLIGAFHLSPREGDIRLDGISHALLGLLRFLESGAEGQ